MIKKIKNPVLFGRAVDCFLDISVRPVFAWRSYPGSTPAGTRDRDTYHCDSRGEVERAEWKDHQGAKNSGKSSRIG